MDKVDQCPSRSVTSFGALLPFVILLVFLELGLRFQKQFLKHLPLVGIGRDLEHLPGNSQCSVVRQNALREPPLGNCGSGTSFAVDQ
jgi:hypothetical protein